METHFEKTLESQTVYEGRVITVTRDTALLEDGTTALRDVVHHHGGACILPYYEDGTICMVRQFRYAMQQELWELPAGKLEAGEDPFEAAKRELTEECGVYADEYISLGQVYPTVGYDTEVIYIWAARGLHPAPMHLDADEFLTPERIPLAQAYEMVLSGEIKDAKTVAGILKFKAMLDDKKISDRPRPEPEPKRLPPPRSAGKGAVCHTLSTGRDHSLRRATTGSFLAALREGIRPEIRVSRTLMPTRTTAAGSGRTA